MRTRTLRTKTTAGMQKKIQDMMIQGWEPEGEMMVDYKTGEVIQKVKKDK